MGISIWQLLIILVIVMLLFGTKRLRNMGGDLGGALKSFRSAMKEESEDDKSKSGKISHDNGDIIDAEVKDKEKV